MWKNVKVMLSQNTSKNVKSYNVKSEYIKKCKSYNVKSKKVIAFMFSLENIKNVKVIMLNPNMSKCLVRICKKM